MIAGSAQTRWGSRCPSANVLAERDTVEAGLPFQITLWPPLGVGVCGLGSAGSRFRSVELRDYFNNSLSRNPAFLPFGTLTQLFTLG